VSCGVEPSGEHSVPIVPNNSDVENFPLCHPSVAVLLRPSFSDSTLLLAENGPSNHNTPDMVIKHLRSRTCHVSATPPCIPRLPQILDCGEGPTWQCPGSLGCLLGTVSPDGRPRSVADQMRPMSCINKMLIAPLKFSFNTPASSLAATSRRPHLTLVPSS
jgi:hypothetical protein